MQSKFLDVVPKFDRNLVPYVDRVLAQVIGIEVEADPESTNCVVLLLPCAGTTVNILVSLQDLDFLDIGYVTTYIILNILKYFANRQLSNTKFFYQSNGTIKFQKPPLFNI